MTIEVTQKNIDEGKVLDCHACPVALALVDAGFSDVTVGPGYTNVKEHKQWVRTPEEALSFMIQFDKGHPVSPFKFEIDFNEN